MTPILNFIFISLSKSENNNFVHSFKSSLLGNWAAQEFSYENEIFQLFNKRRDIKKKNYNNVIFQYHFLEWVYPIKEN